MASSLPSTGCGGRVCAYSTWLGPWIGAICMPVRFIPTLVSFSISAPFARSRAPATQFSTRRPLVAGRYRVGWGPIRIEDGTLFDGKRTFLVLRDELSAVRAQRNLGFQHLTDELPLRPDLQRIRHDVAKHFLGIPSLEFLEQFADFRKMAQLIVQEAFPQGLEARIGLRLDTAEIRIDLGGLMNQDFLEPGLFRILQGPILGNVLFLDGRDFCI